MTLLLLIGAVPMLLLLSALIGKSPVVVLYAITAFSVIVWDFPAPLSIGSFGGTSVQVEDALIAAVILTVMYRPQRFMAALKPYMLAVVISGLALILALVYGVVAFGPSAVNEFRSFLYPLAAVAWGLNQDWSDSAWQGKVRRWAIVTGALLSLTAGAHIALYGVGRVDSFVHSVLSGVEQTGRPLTAGQAILLCLCGVFLLQGLSSKKRTDVYWAALFVVVTLVAQHRSVWIALAIGCLFLFFKVHGAARVRLAVGALMAAWAGTVLALSGFFDPFADNVASSVDNVGTYNARTGGWQALVDQTIKAGIGPISFGSPFGTGFRRVEHGVLEEFAPHNWYVTVYLRLGLIGLSAFLIVIFLIAARLLRSREAGAAAAAAVFAAILTYCWAYSLSWYIAPFFAWAMWRAGSAPRQIEPSPSPVGGYLTPKWSKQIP